MAGNLCSRCSKKRRISSIDYCKSCLCRIVEQRVKKALSSGGALGGELVAGRKNSLAGASAAYFAKKMAAAPHYGGGKSTIILPSSADDLAAGFLEKLINAKVGIAKGIAIFESVTEKELSLYASMKRIKYVKAESTGLKRAVQSFQEEHPGTIEAFTRTEKKIRMMRNGGN